MLFILENKAKMIIDRLLADIDRFSSLSQGPGQTLKRPAESVLPPSDNNTAGEYIYGYRVNPFYVLSQNNSLIFFSILAMCFSKIHKLA